MNYISKTLSTVLAAVTVLIAPDAAARTKMLLDGENWQFAKGKSLSEAQVKNEWEKVVIPHCWNATDGTTPEYFRGRSVYRCSFAAPKGSDGQRVFVRFEGVSMCAKVWLNGRYLGEHRGSFTAFCFELTPFLKKTNVLEVEVDNSKQDNVIPQDGDFTIFGGIYRHVSLFVAPKQCFALRDFASSGVYVTPKLEAGEKKVTLNVRAKVDCKAMDAAGLKVRATLFDPNGQKVGSMETSESKINGSLVEYDQTMSVENPILWNGKGEGKQYRVAMELLKGRKVIDTMSVMTGFRNFKVDADKGFFLNGRSYQLRGVNRHQDRKDKGWGITDANHDEDMKIIEEIGANALRLAHYPQADYFYSLCDEKGLLVWAEIPLIGKATPSASMDMNIRTQLTELIRQNYNHPSIFCWSLFNELGGSGHYGDLISMLNDLAHHEDATRYTVAAANNDGRPENDVTDIMACNTYPGWYWSTPETMSYAIDWKRKPYGRGVGVSEYGAGASIKHHDQHIDKAPKTDGEFHPEEWQAKVHEVNYREINKRDFVWGSFVWNMFDFASAGRHEGDALGINDKGLVTYDRKVKKDAFYFYKANWNKNPMVHITSKRDEVRKEALTDVKLYSNCSEVTLKVNGKAVSLEKGELGVYVAKGVVLQKGENIIEATGVNDDGTVTDSCVWKY
ncbi:MAG: glycoside hydrolase family 2 TIM barrel-domain containing protein [Bacteroidales bacterium]|nr:glycoside hydrolase family 2 TIM barrel-domain containing protein [Bacteroidales bacterium]